MNETFQATTWTSQFKCFPIAAAIEGPTLAAAQPQSCLASGWNDQKMVSSGVKELLIEASCHVGACWEQDDETQLLNGSILYSIEADLLICKTRNRQNNQKHMRTWYQTNNLLVTSPYFIAKNMQNPFCMSVFSLYKSFRSSST